MADNLEHLMSGFENQSFNLDLAILIVELVSESKLNNEILKEILVQQLELKELITGTPNDINETVKQKYSDLMDKMNEVVKEKFYELIKHATKD